MKWFYRSAFCWEQLAFLFISLPGKATVARELDLAPLPLFEDVECQFREIKSHLSNDRIATPARTKCALESLRTFHLPTRATPLDWITPVSWALHYSHSIHASKLSRPRLDCAGTLRKQHYLFQANTKELQNLSIRPH